MFVASSFSDRPLPDNITAALEEFGNNNQVEGVPRPIRVLFGRFQVTVPGPWTSEEAEACGTNVVFAQEHGLTLVVWGSASPSYGREFDNLPNTFYLDEAARELEIRDIVVPTAEGVRQAIPFHIGGADAPDVGEFLERTVWYFMYLSYLPDADKLDIDSIVIEPLRRSMRPDITNEFQNAVLEASAKAFADLMSHNPEQRVQSQREMVRDNELRLSQYERAIRDTMSNLDLQRRELDAIMASFDVPAEHWIEEWKNIAQHPMIAPGTLNMSGQTVNYDTKLIHITDSRDGTEIPLGRMRISVDMQMGNVTIRNLNNRRRDRDHPHVPDGDPCFGGYHSELMDHINNHRLAALVEFLFGYLQTYNDRDDYGRYISYWRDSPELLAA